MKFMTKPVSQVVRSRSRRALIAAAVIGVGLMVAPVVFQMFTRAPLGASMITDFDPYMQSAKIEEFQGYLAVIDAAEVETRTVVRPALEAGGLDSVAYDSDYPNAANLNDQWDTIDFDMTDLLDTMDRNLDNFAAIKALPSFDLFPWFFVLPGLFIAAVAGLALRARAAGRDNRRLVMVLAGLGVAVVLAPAVFQMFTRAPKGGDMINDFRPMMTRERVIDVQGYFITLGAGEGELRNKVIPVAAEAAGLAPDESGFPAVTVLSANWPTIVTDFAPMIAAMSDNVDNYEAVDALPPFPLFPWFFVIPGVLVAVLAATTLRGARADEPADGVDDAITESAPLPTKGTQS